MDFSVLNPTAMVVGLIVAATPLLFAALGELVVEKAGVLNLGVGLDREQWSAELYMRNVFDERGDVFINAVNWDSRVTVNRPRTIGLVYRRNFQ